MLVIELKLASCQTSTRLYYLSTFEILILKALVVASIWAYICSTQDRHKSLIWERINEFGNLGMKEGSQESLPHF